MGSPELMGLVQVSIHSISHSPVTSVISAVHNLCILSFEVLKLDESTWIEKQFVLTGTIETTKPDTVFQIWYFSAFKANRITGLWGEQQSSGF